MLEGREVSAKKIKQPATGPVSGEEQTATATVVAKKYRTFSSRARTLQQQFSESNEPFLDRLDIFSDATDLKNTLVLLFLRHLPPQSQIN